MGVKALESGKKSLEPWSTLRGLPNPEDLSPSLATDPRA